MLDRAVKDVKEKLAHVRAFFSHQQDMLHDNSPADQTSQPQLKGGYQHLMIRGAEYPKFRENARRFDVTATVWEQE